MTDPISDMITRIRNASAANKESLVLPYSKIKEAILAVLAKEQYIKSIEKYHSFILILYYFLF